MRLIIMFSDLIKFLRRQSRFCHNIPTVLRETVILRLLVADADHIADLVPEKIGVEAVGGKRFLMIIQFSLAARQMKTVLGMGEGPFAHLADLIRVDKHIDCDGNFHAVGA